MSAPDRRRQVLAYLADEGQITDSAGMVNRQVAAAVGLRPGHCSTILHRLEAKGLVERDYRQASRRTFRLTITPEGRAELGRARHVSRVLPRREPVPVVAPPMPVLGPIERRAFDPDRVRAVQAAIS